MTLLSLASGLPACLPSDDDCPLDSYKGVDAASNVKVTAYYQTYGGSDFGQCAIHSFAIPKKVIITSSNGTAYEATLADEFVYTSEESSAIADLFPDLAGMQAKSGSITLTLNRDDLKNGVVTFEFREGDEKGSILNSKSIALKNP